MAKAVISYDKDLPEIPDRCPWQPPSLYLVKDQSAPSGWREEKAGRRPSLLLLIAKLRQAVDRWRKAGYPALPRSPFGSSNTGSKRTTRLPASPRPSDTTSASARRSKR